MSAGPGLSRGSRWAPLAGPLVVFVVVFAATLALYSAYPNLQDTDSYFHLALAREIAHHGIPATLPWARFTPAASRFGDGQLLFHLGLAPFAAGSDAEAGGRLALALYDATVFAALAALGQAALGAWGLLLPFALCFGSTEAAWRLVRLRPEHLSLLLLLASAWLAVRRRFRWLAVAALAHTLAYAAGVPVYLGCFVLLFLLWGVRDQRWEWRLPLYATLGSLLGLVLHPQFPANLAAMVLTLEVPFAGGSALGLGRELEAPTTRVALLTQLGLWIAAVALWRARTPLGDPPEDAARARDAFGVLALAYGALYALHVRFILFAWCFGALWFLWLLAARGERPGATLRVVGKRRAPLVLALAVAALAAAWPFMIQAAQFTRRAAVGPNAERLVDRREFAALLPAGARVAAPWGSSDLYTFYAPQAQYLQVLDPTPMAAFAPEAFAAQRRVFEGSEVDTPLVVATTLESEYIATPRSGASSRLLARLNGDPRIEVLHDGIQLLVRVVPGRNGEFVLDWRLAPSEDAAQDPRATDRSWPAYPRAQSPLGRSIEGFVDLRRLKVEGCAVVVHDWVEDAASERRLVLSPAGAAALSLDGRRVLTVGTPGGALPGDGVEVPLAIAAGPHRLAVRSCPGGPEVDGRNGFYLRWRHP